MDGILTINGQGIIELVNPAALAIFGYAQAELVGQNVSMLMPEPYRSDHDGYLANYHRTGERKIIGIGREVVGRRKDGSIFPVDLSVSEIPPDAPGGVRRFAGVVRDITARKQAEAEILRLNEDLRRKVAELEALLEVVPIGVGVADDPACRSIRTNPVLARMLELAPNANASLSAPKDRRPNGYKVMRAGVELALRIYHYNSPRGPARHWRMLNSIWFAAMARRRHCWPAPLPFLTKRASRGVRWASSGT